VKPNRAQVPHEGERTNAAGKPIKNKILLWIPDGEFRELRPYLEFEALPSHFSLHGPGEKLVSVYFPNSGLISMVIETEDGRTVEAGVIGKEGVAAMPLVVGMTRSPLREVVQIAGEGFHLDVGALHATLRLTSEFQRLLGHYAVVQSLQVAQTAACNRLHDLEQRLARWLLMAQDRVDTGSLSITHDFLATMLGTDRPSVTLAAGTLQKKKIIEYGRGAVKILNRKRLEASACECYRVIQQFNGEMWIK
jgi:CRP-like cAMP-binding protein